MTKLQTLLGSELTEILKQANHELAQEAVLDEPPEGLKSPQQKATQLEAQANMACERLCIELLEAAAILSTSLKVLSHQININLIADELIVIGDQLNHAGFEDPIDDEPIVSISDETLDALFTASASLMDENRFADCVKVFSLLCTLAPNRYKHWIGYGHAAYHDKQFDVAIAAYYQAADLQTGNPWPLIWAANGCEAKNEYATAFDLLTAARECAVALSDKALADELKVRLSILSTKK